MRDKTFIFTFVLPMLFSFILLYFNIVWLAIVVLLFVTAVNVKKAVHLKMMREKSIKKLSKYNDIEFNDDFCLQFIPLVSLRGNVLQVYLDDPDYYLDAI